MSKATDNNTTDIYLTIRTDFHNWYGSVDDSKKNYYDRRGWLREYLGKTLRESDKQALVSRYGIVYLQSELPSIAKNNCYESYNDFLEEYGITDAYHGVLMHIVERCVIPELEHAD